jgi:GMP synthase PP-ATPase subunit
VYIESGEIGSREFVSQLTAIKSQEKKKKKSEKMQSENFVTTFGEQSSTHGAHTAYCVFSNVMDTAIESRDLKAEKIKK